VIFLLLICENAKMSYHSSNRSVKETGITMKLLTTCVLLILLPGMMLAQKSAVVQKKIETLYQEALELSQQGNSASSAMKLHEILNLDPNFYQAFFALADLSHESGKIDDEIGYLTKGLSLSEDGYIAGFKFLAEALYKKGEYLEALNRVEHYASLKKVLTPVEKLLLLSCRFSAEAINHPVSFLPVNPGDSINTTADEYWPSINAEANKLVFTRLETRDLNGERIQRPQEDFYCSQLDSAGWRKAKPLGAPINTDENEGAQTLSADGRLLIFTGCGRADGMGSCDLYISVNRNGSWTPPVNMGEPVNSGAWESQPSLSADGETLYFVSSRKGGVGNMDIWKAEKISYTPDGLPIYGHVTNVIELNSPGNDLSPFLHADGKTLYFATNGIPGLGGTDLFVSRMKNDLWTAPVNLGYPLNTNGNEDGLIVEISGERAWYSSNRNTANGRDIYYFSLPDSMRPEPVSYLRGIVLDANTGQKIKAEIRLTNLKYNKIVRTINRLENEGEFLVCLPSGYNYGLNITCEGYLFASENLSLVNGFSKSSPKMITINLHPIVAGAYTTLKNIFFETDSWLLKEESRSQLDEMARFMIQNPGVVMEIVGHTDRVGTEAYNLELSAKRAETVVTELKNRGIAPYRMKSRGAGFSSPIGDNASEEGRRANRRTEFFVKEVKKE
jgi:hypothetical protein